MRNWFVVPFLSCLLVSPAVADTLREALSTTYLTNPRLTGGRAGLRALDEGVAQAEALRRPSVSASVGLNQDFGEIGTFDNDGRNVTADLSLDVPLFRGGLIGNSVRAAEERVQAGRYELNALENALFLDATQAYMDVLADSSVVMLNRNNVRVLEEQLRASRDRFEVGDLTRTDVAQSEARLSLAQADLRAAEAQLVASEEAYTRVVGEPPQNLQPPAPLPELPDSARQAVLQALEENPTLIAARRAETAARFDVRTARSERTPSVFASTGARYQNFLGTLNDTIGAPDGLALDNQQTEQFAGVSVTVPLYQAGAVSSRIREAQARQSQALEDITNTERLVIEDVRNAYEQLLASRAVIRSASEAVRANELALEGTRAENLAGLRNVLDVLNAEQELLNSRVALVRARRDEYVAGFALLSAIGRADTEDLNLEVARYDPDLNYERVRRLRAGGTGVTPKPEATSTAPLYEPPAKAIQQQGPPPG